MLIDLSHGQDTHRPNGISLDLAERRLYWVEGSTGAIFSASLNGTDRTKLPVSIEGGSFMYGVAVHGDYVYWSDVAHQSIKRRHKLPNEGEDRGVIIQNSHMAFGLEVVHTNREIGACAYIHVGAFVCVCLCVSVCVCVSMSVCMIVHNLVQFTHVHPCMPWCRFFHDSLHYVPHANSCHVYVSCFTQSPPPVMLTMVDAVICASCVRHPTPPGLSPQAASVQPDTD